MPRPCKKKKSEEPKDRHRDGLEKLRQEVARMEQEKNICGDSSRRC